MDPNAFIEIFIKTNGQETLMKAAGSRSGSSEADPNGQQAPGSLRDRSLSPQNGGIGGSKRGQIGIPNSQLTCIDERTSESGFKDVIDRKEFEYQYEIQKINKKIDDFDNVTTLIQE